MSYVVKLAVTCGRLVVFSGDSDYSTNITDHYEITEILLKVALNTANLTQTLYTMNPI
jgi:hypothetical protein